MKKLSQQAEQANQILGKAVQEALLKKKLLGQFAIVNKNGKPERLESAQIEITPNK